MGVVDRPVVGEATCSRTVVRVSCAIAVRGIDAKAARGVPSSRHRWGQHVPARMFGAFGLHSLVQVQQCRHRDLEAAGRRVDDGQIARFDPTIQRRVADAQHARGKCVAGRDWDYTTEALNAGIVQADVLFARLPDLPVDGQARDHIEKLLRAIAHRHAQ